MPGRNIDADWLFNSLGDQVFDLSGHGHIGGMVGNPVWDNGKLGHGLRCDGVLDHVVTAGNINFTGASSFSVLVLFSTTQALADNYIAGTGLADGWYFRIGSAAPAGYLMIKIDDGVDDAFIRGMVGGFHDGNLHQFVLVWDAPNNLLEAFADGISWGTDFQLNVGNMANIVWLGGCPGAPPRYFTGLIEQTTIFDRALLTSEVAKFYREAFYRYPENRVFAVA